MATYDHTLDAFDPDIFKLLAREHDRQEQTIDLIASENYVSRAVAAASGSFLTNKYAEGYPQHRYYGGCEHVDEVEVLAIERVKQLFGADYANVQPHSGSDANAAAYLALMKPGDTLMGMALPDGGHLTHGASVSFSGAVYRSVQYGIDPSTGEFDFAHIASLAKAHKPRVIVAGFSAYSKSVDWQDFRTIADQVGAYLMVDMAHVAGLIAAGCYPNPIPIADVVTSTTHKTLRGPRGGIILARANPEIEKKLNSAVFPGVQGGPMMHTIAAKAVAFKEALQPEFKAYQQQVVRNAKVMVACLQQRGYQIVSGGTENHLFLVDLTEKSYSGKAAEAWLGTANLIVNKNTVPNETRSPFVTSGLRIGTPAMTTRGCRDAEATLIAGWIADLLDAIDSKPVAEAIRTEVLCMCQRLPVYSEGSGAHA